TTIQKFSQGTLSDLAISAQVRLTGQQSEDGTFEASAVFMVPEDGGFGGFGGGLFGGRGGFQPPESDTASP
ncbi:MAG: hypothetical protein IIB15_01705, partial [Chloroflexi bacterium]|nr:hypothetical protein [Chloroflexota bacterium]